MSPARYTLTIDPTHSAYVVNGPDGQRVFQTVARAIDFIACMEAIERDIARLVRCHGLAAMTRATLESFGGPDAR